MRILEIIAGLIVAAIVFEILKLIGMVVHLALAVAVLGFVGGFAATWILRSKLPKRAD